MRHGPPFMRAPTARSWKRAGRWPASGRATRCALNWPFCVGFLSECPRTRSAGSAAWRTARWSSTAILSPKSRAGLSRRRPNPKRRRSHPPFCFPPRYPPRRSVASLSASAPPPECFIVRLRLPTARPVDGKKFQRRADAGTAKIAEAAEGCKGGSGRDAVARRGTEGHVVVVGSNNFDMVVKADRLLKEGENVMATGLKFFPGGKGGNQA